MIKKITVTALIRIQLFFLVAGSWPTVVFAQGAAGKQTEPLTGVAVAAAWADMTVRVMTGAPNNTPTYGSRAIGYMGLTMYETVVPGSKQYQSVGGQLCDTLALPTPDPGESYCWELALNAGQAYMLKGLYGYTNRTKLIDSLANAVQRQYTGKVASDVIRRSEAFGLAVASRLFQWSKSDGGHEGYTRNFPASYVAATGPGLWSPPYIGQVISQLPLHPTWGNNRPFASRNAQLPVPAALPYSTDSTSSFYQYYREVYLRKKALTPADRAIVVWWGDDPTETFAPPGHSYRLATIAIRKSGVGLVEAAETYARVGMAVADAFICCWKTKFALSVVRPAAYINEYVHKTARLERWNSLFPEPPFPAFYSGHAVQAGAMATILTALYGSSFPFTDDSHVGRHTAQYTTLKARTGIVDESTGRFVYPEMEWHPLPYVARHYASFWDAARECAESRLLGGIHTRYDNEVGLVEGAKIGGNINAFNWKR